MPIPETIPQREYAKFCYTPAEKVAVRVCGDSSDPLPISIQLQGAAEFSYGSGITSTTNTTYLSYVVPVGKTLRVEAIKVISRAAGKFVILEGATVYGSGRTGPAESNINFTWPSYREVATGLTLEVKHQMIIGIAPSDIEIHLQGRLI